MKKIFFISLLFFIIGVKAQKKNNTRKLATDKSCR